MTFHHFKRFVFLAFFATSALANHVPTPYKADHRNAWIDYRPHDVVSIRLPFADTLTIYLNQNEMIDVTSFHSSASSELNMLPPKEGANSISFSVTNAAVPIELTFNTNQHTYVFHIQADPKASPLYTLTFRYPHTVAKVHYAPFVQKPTGRKLNQLYWLAGDDSIKPTSVWDDGVFTYFTFPLRTKLPSFYSVYDALGDEEKDSTTAMRGGRWIAVMGISREFTLRLGRLWVQVLNQGYDHGKK